MMTKTQGFFEERQKKQKESSQRLSVLDRDHYFSREELLNRRTFMEQEQLQSSQLSIKRLEDKLRHASNLSSLRRQEIINKGLNHSQIVEHHRELAQELSKQRLELSLVRNAEKAQRTKSKIKTKCDDYNRLALRLQQMHQNNGDKLRRIKEEEENGMQQKLRWMSEKQEKEESKISQRNMEMREAIEARQEKEKLKQEDIIEHARMNNILKEKQKQKIIEKYLQKDRRINEMKSTWYCT